MCFFGCFSKNIRSTNEEVKLSPVTFPSAIKDVTDLHTYLRGLSDGSENYEIMLVQLKGSIDSLLSAESSARQIMAKILNKGSKI